MKATAMSTCYSTLRSILETRRGSTTSSLKTGKTFSRGKSFLTSSVILFNQVSSDHVNQRNFRGSFCWFCGQLCAWLGSLGPWSERGKQGQLQTEWRLCQRDARKDIEEASDRCWLSWSITSTRGRSLASTTQFRLRLRYLPRRSFTASGMWSLLPSLLLKM